MILRFKVVSVSAILRGENRFLVVRCMNLRVSARTCPEFIEGSAVSNPLPGWRNLVDARDLKSLGGIPPCRFESGPRYHK